MSSNDPKAVIKLEGEDLFIGYTPLGNPITIDTDWLSNSRGTPTKL
jgi:hypothetical protein